MTYKFIIISLFIVGLSYSQQSQTGRVTYVASSLPINLNFPDKRAKEKEISPEMKNMMTSYFNNSEEIIYILHYNRDESIFFKSKLMNTPNKKRTITGIIVGNGKYYTNVKEKKILNQKEFLGELFLIESNFFNWELSQESRKIGKYICYKAVGTKITENSKGVFKRLVTAWYTPEIPVNFGPKEYGGLPGLILELQEWNLIIKAEKIELNPKKRIRIKAPTKGRKLNIIEYKLLVKGLFHQRKK